MNTVASQSIVPSIPSENDWTSRFASTQLSDQDWLRTFQAAQREAFYLRGFPTRKEEKWKYTDLSLLARKFKHNELKLPIKKENVDIHPTNSFEAIRLFFIDGFFVESLSSLSLLPHDVIVSTTNKMLREDEKLLSPLMTETYEAVQFPLACLNAGMMTEGLFIKIPNHFSLTLPIHCLFIQTQENIVVSPRNIIMVGENSFAAVIEEYRGKAQHYLTNVVTQMMAGPNASIEYYKIQQEALEATHFSNVFISQSENSSVNSFSVATGGRLAREEIHIAAKEKQSNCQLSGVYFLAQDSQQLDHYLHVDHSASFCTSSMIYKGVMNNKSRAVFNGKVLVREDAKNIHAHQENHNLLLSSQAEINTKPELEIYADDVKCTHGATVGQLDAESLFYFRSRGIDEAQAKAMLQEAFVMDLYESINNTAIKKYLQQQVNHHAA